MEMCGATSRRRAAGGAAACACGSRCFVLTDESPRRVRRRQAAFMHSGMAEAMSRVTTTPSIRLTRLPHTPRRNGPAALPHPQHRIEGRTGWGDFEGSRQHSQQLLLAAASNRRACVLSERIV